MDIRYRLYPHPILWEYVDDYKNSKFDCNVVMKRNFRNFILEVSFKLENIGLQKMIDDGLAEFLVHVESPKSSFRIIKSSDVKEKKITISEKNILGKVSICSFIVAKKDIDNFFNNDWDEEYGGLAFQVSKGSILAIGSQYTFYAEKKDDGLSHFPSIFTIYKKETTEEMPLEIEINDDKIKVGLNIKDYENYSPTIYQNQEIVDIVNSFIIFPVLIYVFERLKENIDEYSNYRWFKSIEKLLGKYNRKLNTDLLDVTSSYELAQMVLDLIISKALKGISEVVKGDE